MLVEVAGQAVSRETLVRTIWPDTIVGDTSLGRNISVLRRHLGADAIQSVPKFGYRFTLPVTTAETPVCPPELPAESDASETAFAGAPPNSAKGPAGQPLEAEAGSHSFSVAAQVPALRSLPVRSLAVAGVALLFAGAVPAWTLLHRHVQAVQPAIASARPIAAVPPVLRLAVLPFHNTSGRQAETDYLRDGFDDELTARLGALQPHRLRVLARGTTRQYLNSDKLPSVIAAESGAHYLLEGSIGFAAGRAQLMASLVNPVDQTIMWSRTFSGSVAELDTIEGEIAEAVADNLDLTGPSGATRSTASTHVLPATQHVSAVAYDEYLRGRFELEQKNLEGYRRALGHFQTASTLAPDYAQAWAGMAETYIFMGGNIPMNECFRRAREAAIKAIQLDPGLGEAHRDLAYILMNDESDLGGAEREYRRAIELNLDDARAHHWYAQLLVAQRRGPDALAKATAGYQLDPRSVGSGSNYGFMLIATGNPASGVRVLEELVRREPAVDYAWGYLGFGYLALRQFAQASAAFDRASTLSSLKINYKACAAFARARGGDSSEAAATLAEYQGLQRAGKWVPAQSMVMVYLALGQHDLARQWMLKGAEDRTTTLFEANTEPVYSEMKDDPGFPAVLARLQRAQ